MATVLGKLQKTKNIILSITWKRDASKESSQGSMFVSCEIMFSANGCSKTIEMKMFAVNGTILQKKITPIECQNQNTFTTGKIGGSPSISQEHYRTNETTFWLQPSVVYIEPFTPRSWRKTTQAHALLEVPAMETGIEFFLHMVAMERILVVFLRIQRKSIKEDGCKGLRSNGATRCSQNFGEYLRRMGVTNSLYFVTDRSFTADGGLLYPKDNTSKDPFSRCEICKNLGYRLSGRSQRQEHHWRHEAQDQHEAQHETVSMRVVLQSS